MLSNPLLLRLMEASEAELDLAFALLKYREIGIYRKVRALSVAFDLNLEEVLVGLPEQDGRLLDKETRHMLHDAMITRASELTNRQAQYA